MDKVQAGSRRARFLKIEELFRTGLSFAKIGRMIDPPISAQWAGSLLRQGAMLGLYAMPTRLRDRNQSGTRSAEEANVLAILRNRKNVQDTASALGCSRSVFERRFGHLISEVRKDGVRSRAIADYSALTRRLGRKPTTAEFGSKMTARIVKHFGSFGAFYRAAGVTPNYPRKRQRQPGRPRP